MLSSAASPLAGALPHLLLALLVVIVASRALGALFRHLGQPRVIGEVVAGILLGPSLLGAVAPSVAAFVFPESVVPHLAVLAQVGVILFMFLVGLDLDTSLLRERSKAALVISPASIVVPFALGAAAAIAIYPTLAGRGVPFGVFALFLGVSMSVTAFPVLARILQDERIQHTPLGVLAISCAAVDDVTAWCLLAFVVAVAQAQYASVLPTVLETAGYLAVMLAVVGPLVRRAVVRLEPRPVVPPGAVAITLIGLLVSALATEWIGIHALFGAFLLGAVIPHDSRLARELKLRLEDLVVVLLLPAFFALTGLRTQIALVSGTQAWLICFALVVVAFAGKFGGTLVAARLTGLPLREAASLGILMNTRGLMELIVLNIGLDLGVISPTLFAMLVLMALATTLATSPVLRFLRRGEVQNSPSRAAAIPYSTER